MTMNVIIIIFPFGSSAIGELLVEIYVYSELFAEFFPTYTNRTCISRPRRGRICWNFIQLFGIRKLVSLRYCVKLLT